MQCVSLFLFAPIHFQPSDFVKISSLRCFFFASQMFYCVIFTLKWPKWRQTIFLILFFFHTQALFINRFSTSILKPNDLLLPLMCQMYITKFINVFFLCAFFFFSVFFFRIEIYCTTLHRHAEQIPNDRMSLVYEPH